MPNVTWVLKILQRIYLNIKHEWVTKRCIFMKKYEIGVLEKLKIK